jgi:hypothetical protein
MGLFNSVDPDKLLLGPIKNGDVFDFTWTNVRGFNGKV